MAGNYHIPAESDAHELTFMQWPNSKRVYGGSGFLRDVQQTIVDVALSISDFEPVVLLADKSHHTQIDKMTEGAVELWDIPTEDLWARDAGPIFGRDAQGNMAVMHIQFNGWGEKQVNTHDSQIAKRVAARLDLPLVPTGLVGEGGGVDHDGADYLIAHESSWRNDNRNPGVSLAELETRLLKTYGAKKMVWSPGLWDLDITDYHIDSLARFTAPGRILMNLPEEPDFHEPFHQAALDTFEALKAAGIEIEVIPEPNKRRVSGYDFVASYVNYYVCNGAVIAPQFGDRRTDAQAVDALSRHYPGREIVTLNTDALGELGGGIHCATQQMPKVG